MKKRLIGFIVLLVLVLASVGYAQIRNSKSSGLGTIDASIITGSGVLTGVLVLTDGTNAATIIVYDSTSATGTVLFKSTVPGTSMFGGVMYVFPVRYITGIYVDISGTGASYIIYYDRGTT